MKTQRFAIKSESVYRLLDITFIFRTLVICVLTLLPTINIFAENSFLKRYQQYLTEITQFTSDESVKIKYTDWVFTLSQKEEDKLSKHISWLFYEHYTLSEIEKIQRIVREEYNAFQKVLPFDSQWRLVLRSKYDVFDIGIKASESATTIININIPSVRKFYGFLDVYSNQFNYTKEYYKTHGEERLRSELRRVLMRDIIKRAKSAWDTELLDQTRLRPRFVYEDDQLVLEIPVEVSSSLTSSIAGFNHQYYSDALDSMVTVDCEACPEISLNREFIGYVQLTSEGFRDLTVDSFTLKDTSNIPKWKNLTRRCLTTYEISSRKTTREDRCPYFEESGTWYLSRTPISYKAGNSLLNDGSNSEVLDDHLKVDLAVEMIKDTSSLKMISMTECSNIDSCDDSNACTEDFCYGALGCLYLPVSDDPPQESNHDCVRDICLVGMPSSVDADNERPLDYDVDPHDCSKTTCQQGEPTGLSDKCEVPLEEDQICCEGEPVGRYIEDLNLELICVGHGYEERIVSVPLGTGTYPYPDCTNIGEPPEPAPSQ